MITVNCPKCRAAYKVDENRIPPSGGVITCKNCQTKIPVKHPPAAPAESEEVIEELSEADEVPDPPPDMTVEEPTQRAMRKPAFAELKPPLPPAPSRDRADALLSAAAKAGGVKKPVEPAEARPVAPGASLYECPHCHKPFYLREAKKRSDHPALAAAPPEPASAASPPDGRKTLLVVDDQEFFRTFARDLLAPRYRVLEADSLASAKRHLLEADLLILDLTLGGENGRDLLKAKPSSCRCLIFSGLDELVEDPAAFRELQKEGADDLLTKSITAGEELKRKVGALLGEQEKSRLSLD